MSYAPPLFQNKQLFDQSVINLQEIDRFQNTFFCNEDSDWIFENIENNTCT